MHTRAPRRSGDHERGLRQAVTWIESVRVEPTTGESLREASYTGDVDRFGATKRDLQRIEAELIEVMIGEPIIAEGVCKTRRTRNGGLEPTDRLEPSKWAAEE